jgi:glycosyltransferase involved in cell wall biosynthesis
MNNSDSQRVEKLQLSVVMSVYNGESYLAEAIQSVLSQSINEFEFIIVDDGSTDSSAAIIHSFKDPRIKIITQQNSGLSAALNRGIQAAQGKYISRMDADDICMPDRFARQLDSFLADSDLVMVGSNAMLIEEDGAEIGVTHLPLEDQAIKASFPQNPFYHSSVTFKKSIFEKCGGYNEDIRQHFEDLLLWLCFGQHGNMKNIETPLLQYRIVPGSISSVTREEKQKISALVKKLIDHKTLANGDLRTIRSLASPKSDVVKSYLYHQFLAKKYLWFNFNRRKARNNILKAIKLNKSSLMMYLLLMLSVLPKGMIQVLYSTYQRNSN